MVKFKVTNDSLSISGSKGNASFSGDSATFSGKGGSISIGEAPPSGLTPIGDTGLYGTVDPIDPRDCEHYPDSPYCGGNPLTKTPVGLDFDFGADGCSVHASVTPTLGFIKLPTQTIAYIKEECREEYERQKDPPDPPPPPPGEFGEWEELRPQFVPPGFKDTDLVIACTVANYLEAGLNWVNGALKWSVDTWQGKMSNLERPSPNMAYLQNQAPAYGIFKGSGTVFSSRVGSRELVFNPHPFFPKADRAGGWVTSNSGALGKSYGDFVGVGTNRDAGNSINLPILLAFYYGKFGDIFTSIKLPFANNLGNAKTATVNTILTCFQVNIAYLERILPDGKQPDQRYKRIPPLPKRPKCCMSCCSPSQQRQNNDNALLRKILKNTEDIKKVLGVYPFNVTLFDANDNAQGAQQKNVSVANVAKGQKLIVEREEKNAKTLGIDQFPIYAPSSVVEDESNGLLGDIGDLKNKIFKQRIESIAELLNWKIKQDYEIFGKWQEYIEIEDSDPTQKGNQKKRVVLPNMARSFRELIVLNSIQIKTTGIMLDAILKMYIDVANNKVSTAVIEAIVRDIQQFLDYPTNEKLLDVPIGIKIPSDNDSPDDKEDLNRFLQNSTVKTNFDDWTGEGSIHDMMLVLLQAASAVLADKYGRA